MKRIGWLTCTLLLLLGCGSDENPLKAPAHLEATVVADDEVRLDWEDRSDNETGFEIQRAPEGGAYRIMIRTLGNVTTITDATVALGNVYRYRVRAYGGSERSSFTNTVTVEMVVDRATAPAAPENLTASAVTATSLALTWVDMASNETAFEIERALQADFSDAEILAADMNETRYEEIDLAPETRYHYRIRAINDAGASVYSAPLTIETPPRPQSPPRAASDLSAEAVSTTRVTLAWSDNSDNEAGFILMNSLDGDSYEAFHTTAANVRSYTHTDRSPATSYHYYVIAYNAAGEAAPTEVAQARTPAPATSAPAAPRDLSHSELTSNAVRLSWTDQSDNEEGFRLERSENQGFDPRDTVDLDPGTTTYQDGGLLAGTRYHYRLLAFNAAGDSTYSESLTVETPPETVTLTAPSGLGVRATSATTATLSWQDNAANEEGFRLFISTDGGQTFTTAAEAIDANATTYTHTGLEPETTYHFRLCAYHGPQTSDNSNVVVATTMSPVPMPEAVAN